MELRSRMNFVAQRDSRTDLVVKRFLSTDANSAPGELNERFSSFELTGTSTVIWLLWLLRNWLRLNRSRLRRFTSGRCGWYVRWLWSALGAALWSVERIKWTLDIKQSGGEESPLEMKWPISNSFQFRWV